MNSKKPEFKSLSHYFAEGRGDIYIVENNRERDNFNDFFDGPIVIDGNEYEVRGIERFCHMPPFREGERIGILVKNRQSKNKG
jgi:hypothetical protein